MATFTEVAPGLLRLSVVPGDHTNVYLLDDVLVDAGAAMQSDRLLRALRGHRVSAVALTHGHFDHQGGGHAVCEALGVPLWCGEGERHAVEAGDGSLLYPDWTSFMARLARRLAGPAHPVARVLHDGDTVGSFTVLETPGHTPGHLAFWRERDRSLVLGDVLFHRNPLTLRRGLAYPYRFLAYDYEANAAAARRLADLEPELMCFGHGEPLRGPIRLQSFLRQPRRIHHASVNAGRAGGAGRLRHADCS
ncbi:MAG: MBL fold metallo-hydrolase [Gemmatimonadota bacterium]|jgi:hydroxyacylglutathione hydrolase